MDDLFAENQQIVGPFFARYPELLTALRRLRRLHRPGGEEARRRSLASFLPELKRRRKRQQALQVAQRSGSRRRIRRAMLDDQARVHAPASPDRAPRGTATPTARLWTTCCAGDGRALGAVLLPRHGDRQPPTCTSDAEANLDYAAAGGNQLPAKHTAPGSPISGIWSGYLEVAGERLLQLRIEADAGAPP